MSFPFASIPSPSFNQIEIGPLDIHVYGILMGLAVAGAILALGLGTLVIFGAWVVVEIGARNLPEDDVTAVHVGVVEIIAESRVHAPHGPT